MKILYDSQAFTGQKFGGISGYFNQLITHHQGLFDYSVSGKVSNNIYAGNFSSMKPFFDDRSFKGKLKLMKLINRSDDKKAIQKEDYDIFHPTYYEAATWPKNKPSVITAHDFNSELLPQYFSNHSITVFKHISFLKASKIICISENTRNDLLRLFPDVPEEKTELVYHALTWDPLKPLPEEEKKKEPYILFTGVRSGYKNFERMVRSIAKVLVQYDLKLLCTGHPFTNTELSLFHSLGISDRITHYYAKDEKELQQLYQKALLFIYPSLYEGFGFPILEAFSAGCPVVLSNTSCFPEIAEDAGAFFDPNEEESICYTVERILGDSERRAVLQEKGYERLNDFSTEKMVQQTSEVYRKAL